MTTNDSSTLSTLISAYRKSVVFAAKVPNAFRMARLFCDMRQSNGGLVLCGVDPDGQVIGLDSEEIDGIYEFFEKLCADLTRTRVEIGTIRMTDRSVVFLVFNTIPAHTDPLRPYSRLTSRVEMI